MKHLKFDSSVRDVLFYKTLKERALEAISCNHVQNRKLELLVKRFVLGIGYIYLLFGFVFKPYF